MEREGPYDVVIIGAGIAGLTSALYSSRQRMKTLVISRDLGGQLLITPEIQNYPGFLSISGYDLINKIKEQAELYGTRIIYDEVTEIEENKGVFRVKTISGSKHFGIALILAFGKAPRDLGVPGESRFKGRGISYCVTCDAPLFKGKKVALVGWGHHALNSIFLLKDYCSRVYWVFPEERPVKDEDLLSRILSDKIEIIPNADPIEVKGTKKVEALIVKDKKTGKIKKLKVDGIFVELGYVAKTDVVKGLVKLNEKGEIIVDKLCKTSREGVFAAGDVTDIPYKQAIISAAQGAIAALSAYNYIAKIKGLSTITSDWRHVPIERKEEEGGFFLKL